MFYSILFIILNSCLCIYSKTDWDNMIDRLDFLIKQSFLIIQCNDKEIQIIRQIETFEQLNSNIKCTNEKYLFEHGKDRIQIIQFPQVTLDCHENHFIDIRAHFIREKASLSKDKNGVNWPFIHTQFTQDLAKNPPIKMKFLDKDKIDITLQTIDTNQLSNQINDLFINLHFLNRPMICHLHLIGLQKKLQDAPCTPIIYQSIQGPICFYKVGNKHSPSHKQFMEMIEYTNQYIVNSSENYIYIHSTKNLHQSIDLISISNNSNENIQQQSKIIEEKKKKNPWIIWIILIISCLIIIFIGIIYSYQKSSKDNENEHLERKRDSQSSNESQISNSDESIKGDDQSIPFSSLKQTTNPKRTTTNWFKLDEEI